MQHNFSEFSPIPLLLPSAISMRQFEANMRHFKCHICLFAVISCVVFASRVRGDGSLADYQRANHLEQATRNTIFRWHIQPKWFDSGNQFWYRLDLAKGEREYVVVNAISGLRKMAFRASDLAAQMSGITGRALSPADMLLDPIDFTNSDQFAQFEKLGRRWRYDL